MNRKVSTIILVTLLALFLGVSGVTGQEPGKKNKLGRSVSDAAMVNSYISYQGKLTEDGSTVTGARDMTFRLYSNGACSTQVGSSIVMLDVPVTEGLFSVKLAVNQSHFSGQGLWLGVDVGDTGTNIVCEEILPAPYALSLRPGAVISDTRSFVELNRYEMGTYSRQYGVYAEAGGAFLNYGVFGKSDGGQGVTGESDSGWGVAGVSDSSIGVHGSSDSSYGVYAISDSGISLRATSGSNTAVWAETSGGYAAVEGHNTTGYGVYANSDSGVGLRAVSDSDTAVWAETYEGFAAVDAHNSYGYGVYGHSDNFHGVLGRSDSASWAGVYAQGTGSGPDIILDGDYTSDDGRIYSDPIFSSSDIILVTNDAVRIDLDDDGGGEDADFEIYDKDDTRIFNVDNSGTTSIRGNLLIQSSSTGDTIIELGEGLDYAEGFDVSDGAEIVPGTVLVIDPDHPGELMVSNTAYDRKVAGIVAGAGGLGSAVRLGPDRFDYDVALAGRVYCNVDATEEGVEPGDLLTTSAIPGYAMKVTDYERAQGAILGKAMEGLEKGEKGQILVLVTLQ